MLTASKDCNLDWKVQYTQYFNISKDYIDVLFRSIEVNWRAIKYTKICMYWYPGFEIYLNKNFVIRIYVISIIEMYKII